MSSHREAPSISKDPVADNTDTYAFRTPGDTVTLITNYVPAQTPAGGPNFYEFGDDVLYEIKVDNNGNGRPNVIYQFRFKTVITNPNTFLYNTGPITSLDSPSWNRRQTYDVTKVTFDSRGRPRQQEDRLLHPVPAVQHRAAIDPRLPVVGAGGGSRAQQRRDRVLRPACRGLLRRPRFDLRPRHAPAVPGRPSHPERELAWRGLPRGDQRPHDRHPGTHPRPDARRFHAHRRDGAGVRHRRVGLREPAEGDHPPARQGPVHEPGLLGAGVAAREPAVQRGRRADGREGRVERPRTRR